MERFGLRLTLAAVALVLLAVPFAALVFAVAGEGPITRLDARVANALNDAVHRSPVAVDVLRAVTELGRPAPVLAVVAAVALYVLRRGRRRLALFLVTTVAGGGLVSTVTKLLVDRPRPVVDHPVATANGKSFPSGHSMTAVVAYGALLFVLLPAARTRRGRRVVVALTAVAVLAVGSSRMLLGVHFLTDVVGGYVLGAAWLALATAAFEAWRTDEGRRPSEPLSEGVEPEAGAALRS